MIETYVDKLIDNLPDNIKNSKTPIKMDLVLSGGAFNGSYLIGALYFLKEMENRNYIKINRISGCSIGSIAGLLYVFNDLNKITKMYKCFTKQFKKKHNLSILKNIKKILGKNICDDYQKANDKLYICYNNVETQKKIVKSNYKNVDELCNSLIKSCFVPYLIDETMCYKCKYIDGLNPIIFGLEPNTKILFLDLLTYDKLNCLINIKNEKNTFHRILAGLLEMHNFFIKNKSTEMCSYVNDWSIINTTMYQGKLYLEKLIVFVLHLLLKINQGIDKNIQYPLKETFMYKLLVQMYRSFFNLFLDTYCF
jgi:hypothetical protein